MYYFPKNNEICFVAIVVIKRSSCYSNSASTIWIFVKKSKNNKINKTWKVITFATGVTSDSDTGQYFDEYREYTFYI